MRADIRDAAVIGRLEILQRLAGDALAQLARARQAPDAVRYATLGNGHASHVAMETFARAAGVQMLHVPFKGGAQAVTAVIGGQIDFLVDGAAFGQVKGGRLKALAVTGNKRVSSLPDVPTLKEQGVDVAVEMR